MLKSLKTSAPTKGALKSTLAAVAVAVLIVNGTAAPANAFSYADVKEFVRDARDFTAPARDWVWDRVNSNCGHCIEKMAAE